MKLTDLNPRYHETIRRQLAAQNAAPVRPVSPAVAQPDHARQAASPHPTQARRPRRVVISCLPYADALLTVTTTLRASNTCKTPSRKPSALTTATSALTGSMPKCTPLEAKG